MRILHSAKSDVGMKRDNNEDNFLVFPEQNLFAVFDGMGGHAAGEVASAIAANEVKEFFSFTGKDEDATWPFKGDRQRNYDENRAITAIKHCDHRVYFDCLAFFELDLRQHTRGRRRYFSVDLVGRDLEQRLVALDAFTHLLQPLCNRSFRDGLAHLRHYHFCRHKFSKNKLSSSQRSASQPFADC